jgi:hypothetical protein
VNSHHRKLFCQILKEFIETDQEKQQPTKSCKRKSVSDYVCSTVNDLSRFSLSVLACVFFDFNDTKWWKEYYSVLGVVSLFFFCPHWTHHEFIFSFYRNLNSCFFFSANTRKKVESKTSQWTQISCLSCKTKNEKIKKDTINTIPYLPYIIFCIQMRPFKTRISITDISGVIFVLYLFGSIYYYSFFL